MSSVFAGGGLGRRTPVSQQCHLFQSKGLLLQFRIPFHRLIYNFDEFVLFLKVANGEDVLGHYIFRLFSMVRKEEMKRLVKIECSVEMLKSP